MNLKMYGYSKCSTCRDALKWLQARGHQVDFHDLFEIAPPVEVIRDLYEKSRLDIQKLFNVSGEVYREMKLKDTIKSMSLEDKLRLLSSNGRLVKRPIVTDGSHVTVGFNANQYQEAWGK